MYTVGKFDGMWAVFLDGLVFKSGLSNSEAWRMSDKLSNEASTRTEDTNAWMVKKAASDE